MVRSVSSHSGLCSVSTRLGRLMPDRILRVVLETDHLYGSTVTSNRSGGLYVCVCVSGVSPTISTYSPVRGSCRREYNFVLGIRLRAERRFGSRGTVDTGR